MSKRLLSERNFIELLLTTDKLQAKALMEIITTSQAEALIEIFTNLLRLKVSEETALLLRRRRRLVKILVDKKNKLSVKLKAIRQHIRQVYGTLLSVKHQLLRLLK